MADSPSFAFPQSLMLPSAAIGVLGGFWARLPEARWESGLVSLLVGLGMWTLLEYGLHRFVLHQFEPFRGWHLEHHREPELPMQTPLLYSLMLVILLLAVPPLLGVRGAIGAGFSGGLLLGMLAQDIVHYKLHQGLCPPGGLLVGRQRDHLFHHGEDERRAFGTLTACWDRLFGTAPPR